MITPLLHTIAQAILDSNTVNLPKVNADDGALATVLGVVWKLIGALAVLFVVIGGLKYTLSNGDSNQINQAKNTILYAVIGMVIAASVFLIVNFVVAKV